MRETQEVVVQRSNNTNLKLLRLDLRRTWCFFPRPYLTLDPSENGTCEILYLLTNSTCILGGEASFSRWHTDVNYNCTMDT